MPRNAAKSIKAEGSHSSNDGLKPTLNRHLVSQWHNWFNINHYQSNTRSSYWWVTHSPSFPSFMLTPTHTHTHWCRSLCSKVIQTNSSSRISTIQLMKGKTSNHFRVGGVTMISGDRGRDVARVRWGREVEEKGRFRRSKITATSSLHSWILSAEGAWLKCMFKIHLTAGARMKSVFTVW